MGDSKFQPLLSRMEEFNQNRAFRSLESYLAIRNDSLYREFCEERVENVLNPIFQEFLSKSNDLLLPLAINNLKAYIDQKSNQET